MFLSMYQIWLLMRSNNQGPLVTFYSYSNGSFLVRKIQNKDSLHLWNNQKQQDHQLLVINVQDQNHQNQKSVQEKTLNHPVSSKFIMIIIEKWIQAISPFEFLKSFILKVWAIKMLLNTVSSWFMRFLFLNNFVWINN